MKWDVNENELPMWVADMDFQTAPEIREAIQKRANHGIFGYTTVSDEWYDAIIQWWRKKHQFKIEKEWLVFCTGVVPGISSMVRKLTTIGENVLIQTPVYNVFFNSIINNGRQVLESPLHYDGEKYSIDFEDLEKKLSNPQTTMMILCNPHNPIGKVWKKETLEKIGDLCWKYHVIVVSDEIHGDLTSPGISYTPFPLVSEKCRENSITCIAPTKTFNLAGLQTAAVVISNNNLRHKVNRGFNTDEVAEPNAFAIEGAIASFTKGGLWLEDLRAYVQKNRNVAEVFIKTEIPEINVVSSQGTYLLWIDCYRITKSSKELSSFIREDTGLYLSDGYQYGKGGESFLRMNIGCPRQTLKDGLQRLKDGVMKYKEFNKKKII